MFGLLWQRKKLKEAKEKIALELLKYGNRIEVVSGFFEGIKGEVKNFQTSYGTSSIDIIYRVWLDCEQIYFSGRSNLKRIDKEK